MKRVIEQVDTPQGEPGFLGAGHIARPVIQRSFAESDPFIMLMDDMLDKKDSTPVGGPHPHAGFETVTLMIEGSLGLGKHAMQAGDMQMMTAGSGIVHTETIDKPSKVRILQLWLNLPKADKWVAPRVQDISLDKVPATTIGGMSVKLYSGTLAGLTSPVQNYTPMILADVALQADTQSTLQVPANYNTFLYMLEGSVTIGNTTLHVDQVGWLNIAPDDTLSDIDMTAGSTGARFVMYSGKPTGDAIKPYGPFIGNDSKDILRLYNEYNQGLMKHVTTLPKEQQLVW
ncbi:MAG TPA: pirin-like C-terminal cupin domain-containing protein [Flavipsychrobacter sp.]